MKAIATLTNTERTISSKFAEIGIDKNYDGMDFSGLTPDAQGWGENHPIFESLFEEIQPELVIEVGTWKGASLLQMIKFAEKLGLPTQFVSIDTWLGSHVALWTDPTYRRDLMLQHGYPSMFRQFVFNLIQADVIGRVWPLPMTTTAAAAVLADMHLQADLIYIDAAHDEEDVAMDIKRYWPLLRSGGVMLGDDYSDNWPGVVRAVNSYAAATGLLLRTNEEKWWIYKP